MELIILFYALSVSKLLNHCENIDKDINIL